MAWQLQDAKQQFSKLVDRAVAEGPQVVTRHGEPIVVVVEVHRFHALEGGDGAFKAVLRRMPVPDDVELDIDPRSMGRDVKL